MNILDVTSIGLYQVRLATNMTIGMASACMVVVCIRLLVSEMRFPGWYGKEANKLATALLTIFFFGAVSRFWAVTLIKAGSDTPTIPQLENIYHVTMWCAIGMAVGVACAIRVMTRNHYEWTASMLVIAGAVALILA